MSSLDGQSWVDKLSMLYAIKGLKLLDKFQVPQTAYTQSKSIQKETAGRPKSEDISDSKEKSVDAGVSKNE